MSLFSSLVSTHVRGQKEPRRRVRAPPRRGGGTWLSRGDSQGQHSCLRGVETPRAAGQTVGAQAVHGPPFPSRQKRPKAEPHNHRSRARDPFRPGSQKRRCGERRAGPRPATAASHPRPLSPVSGARSRGERGMFCCISSRAAGSFARRMCVLVKVKTGKLICVGTSSLRGTLLRCLLK